MITFDLECKAIVEQTTTDDWHKVQILLENSSHTQNSFEHVIACAACNLAACALYALTAPERTLYIRITASGDCEILAEQDSQPAVGAILWGVKRHHLQNVLKQMYRFSNLIQDKEFEKASWHISHLEDTCIRTVKHIKQQFALDCADIADSCLEGWNIENKNR